MRGSLCFLVVMLENKVIYVASVSINFKTKVVFVVTTSRVKPIVIVSKILAHSSL